MLIEGVVDVPMVRKMDDEILKSNSPGGCNNSRRWAKYMKEKFKGSGKGILVFGMHTWIQRKCGPNRGALTLFLNFLNPMEIKSGLEASTI